STEEARAMNEEFDRAGIRLARSFVGGSLGNQREWIDMIRDGGGQAVTLLTGWPSGVVWSPGRETLPKEELYARLGEAITYGKQQGLHVSVGAPNTTRAPVSEVVDLCRFAANSGADRIHLYDSFGIGL